MMECATKIVDVGGVAIRVSDQESAVRFYVDTLGFETVLDVSMGDGTRWVQVAPPAGRVPIALMQAEGEWSEERNTGITLSTSDAEADHVALAASGVAVEELLRWPGVPPMFIFRDPDGNQLKVMEREER